MDYQESLDYLKILEKLGIKFRLENTRELISALGFDYDGLVVHVAGTNGKGSCAATLASIISCFGKKVGLYTSPELVDFRERIKVDGVMISPEKFSEITSNLKPLIDSMQDKPTFFEATTALALKHFADEGVDAMVLEAGMGGRLDSTNAIPGDMSIITNVSLDHMGYLGSTASEIAFEKSGIITPGTCLVTSAKEPGLSVLHRESIKKKSEIMRLGKEFRISNVVPTLLETSFTVETAADTYILKSPLIGDFQAENIACAVVAAEKIGIAKDKIVEGVSRTVWQGRMQTVSEKPHIIVDCAHNPEGFKRTLDFIRHRGKYRKLILVVGFSKDKDYSSMLSHISLSDTIIATRYQGERSLSPDKILEHVNGLAYHDLQSALTYATSTASDKDIILVNGSIYLAGEALRLFSPTN
ncbi:MAG: bifunctional folylpolyglutamate synthase/dihydrofolate synthase [Candidatus Altiarchaeota archaeon]|nr:bifunctional folylpolyglutamate synthase/dihydrofolate synthase [Candidatus Altiarchaeota archaeon]